MFEWLCQRLNKKIWVERSGASLIFVDALYRMYPSAKFIHLYRDGRDVALSMREFPPIGLLAQSWSDAKKFGINLLKPPFRLGESPYVAAAAKLSGLVERVAVRLDRKAEIGVAGEFWSAMVSVGLESLSKVPAAQKFDIRYEDLIATPGETLRDLIQFIEPDLLDDDWVDAARSIVGPNRSRRGFLTAADAALLDFACAPGLKALGYNEPPLPGEAPARNQSHASITAPIDT
jgi:putative sulfotransferase